METLRDMLSRQQFPFIRMPWWGMGTDGHITRPAGLVSQSYHHGQLDGAGHVKTIAIANEVMDWQSSHHPTALRHPSAVLSNGMTAEQFVMTPFLRPDEKTIGKCEPVRVA
jgi:hypothetical protein